VSISIADLLAGGDPAERLKQQAFGGPVYEERTTPQMPLREFVQAAWPVLEPETPFLANWHVDAICEHLEAIATEDLRRLIINVPPGTAKSMIVSVLWPAWMWHWRPGWRSIFSSYDMQLALRDAVKSRMVLTSGWYQDTFRPQWVFTSDQNVKGYYRNSRMGERLALSVGLGTGFRANCVCVDDPLKVMDAHSETKLDEAIAWWDTSMSSRLNDLKRGAHVIIMQRLHDRDLTGHVLAKESGYQLLALPSEFDPKRRARTVTISGKVWEDPRAEPGELLFPALFPADVLEQAKKDLGSWNYAAQHQQRPLPATGGIFQRRWFQFYRRRELPPVWHEKIQSWDMAFKKTTDSDYVVGQTWARLGANCYLMRERRGRMGFPETKRAVVGEANATPEASLKLIEDKANGPAIISELRDSVEGLVPVSDPGGVLAQAWAVSPMVEAGQVWLPHPEEWPEVEEWLTEVCGYPKAAHDDRVAAFTQAIQRLQQHIRHMMPAASEAQDAPKPSEAALIAAMQF
jgi:predicted phage terminase large subunit-like protein